MGAMTQFVPVWSGVSLYSRRLARRQLVLVTVGLLGFASGVTLGVFLLVAVGGAVMLAGFWVFVATIALTLGREPVPMVDDLYDHRLAVADWWALVAGSVLLLASRTVASGPVTSSDVAGTTTLAWAGGLFVTVGVVLFVTNIALLVHPHSRHSLVGLFVPATESSGPESRRERESADDVQ